MVCTLRFLSHPVLSELLSEEDEKVCDLMLTIDFSDPSIVLLTLTWETNESFYYYL
jgi:hypothetical protein